MDRCFVIQPFDNAQYDQRYDQVYKLGIEEAAFQPYRVDRDPTASIPIENIERGIRDSAICFADISEDNPNVWFELGLAIVHQKEICIVCSESRARFPFDIQHRLIIRYRTAAPNDFQILKSKIIERIRAVAEILSKRADLPELIERAQQKSDDLADYEIACLGALAGSLISPESSIPLYELQREMASVGYTDLATNTSIRRLQRYGYLRLGKERDEREDYVYDAVKLEDKGWSWVEQNISKFVLKKKPRG
jgi:hypothetical protein